MLRYAGIYLAIFLVMFVIDMVWLRVIAINIYQDGMGSLLTDSPNLVAAAAFYLLFPIGLLIFAVLPSAGTAGLLQAAGMGALFGLFCYGTYDLTNLAVIRNWPLGLTFIDMAWGAFASGVSSAAGKLGMDYLS